jgi:prevent-host-death family protein
VAREFLDLLGQPGSETTETLKPWRRASREARALPRSFRGPVLDDQSIWSNRKGFLRAKSKPRESKARLPRLLDAVERGETVIIPRHGKPIAHIVPEIDLRQAEFDA